MNSNDLHRMLRGELTPAETLAIGRHLSTCAECAALSREEAGGDRAIRRLWDQAGNAPAEEHPDPETELVRFVEGRVDEIERAAIEEHLETCKVCREDVADLQASRESLQHAQRRRFVIPASIAAGIAVAVFIGLLSKQRDVRPPPTPVVPSRPPTVSTPSPAGYGRAEWDRLVDVALRSGKPEITPSLAELRGVTDVYRGEAPASVKGAVRPAGTIVESARPEFSWPAAPGARYVVFVYAGGEEVARSETLRSPSWTPDRDLPRGKTLTWQVEAVRDGEDPIMIPAPPEPPAVFRVLGRKALAEISDARRQFPEDHLLQGVLFANHGLLDEAERELTQHVASHPEDRRAATLLDHLRGGKRSPQ